MPSATFIGFLATFVSLSASFGLSAVRQFIAPSAEFEFDYILLMMIFFMAIRHQIRVVFMDQLLIEHCRPEEDWRLEFWLVLIISSLGGVILTFYFYGRTQVSAVMFVYCFLFAILGALSLLKMYRSAKCDFGEPLWKWKEVPKTLLNVGFSFLVDLLLFILWARWLLGVSMHGVDVPSALDMSFAFLIVAVMLFTEFFVAFWPPVRERLRLARNMLASKDFTLV